MCVHVHGTLNTLQANTIECPRLRQQSLIALPIGGSRGFLRQPDRAYKQGRSSEKRNHHKPNPAHINNDRQQKLKQNSIVK
jgi:hypothetical protein